jgi:hypothetical protein
MLGRRIDVTAGKISGRKCLSRAIRNGKNAQNWQQETKSGVFLLPKNNKCALAFYIKPSLHMG